MDMKKMLEVDGDDITRVNIDPSRRGKILAKCGAASRRRAGA